MKPRGFSESHYDSEPLPFGPAFGSYWYALAPMPDAMASKKTLHTPLISVSTDDADKSIIINRSSSNCTVIAATIFSLCQIRAIRRSHIGPVLL